MLKVPDWSCEWWGHPWHHRSSLYVILYLHAEFQLFIMFRSVSGTPSPWSHIWRTLKVPDWSLGRWGHPWYHGSSLLESYLEDVEGSWRFLTWVFKDGVILDIMDHHYMWLFTCVQNFSFLAWLEVYQELSVLEVILGGHWWFLTGVLEDGVIFDILNHLDSLWWSYPECFVKIWLHLADLWGVEILARMHARMDSAT